MRTLRLLLVLIAMLGIARAGEPSMNERIAAALDSVSPKCLTADLAKDLEPLKGELKKLREECLSQTPWDGLDVLDDHLDDALYLVEKWQDYLTRRATATGQESLETLNDLLKNERWLSLMPRSKVLALRQEYYAPKFVRLKTESIDDLPAVIASLKSMARGLPDPSDMNSTITRYTALLAAWEGRKDHSADELEAACQISSNDYALNQFKLLILSQVVADYLRLNSKYHLPPKKGQSAPSYLADLLATASAKKDLVTMWRVMTYRDNLTREKAPWAQEEQVALDDCLTARALEASGNPEAATTCYLRALQRKGTPETLSIAEEQLVALKQKSPEAYRLGAEGLPQTDSPRWFRSSSGVSTPIQSPDGSGKLWEKY